MTTHRQVGVRRALGLVVPSLLLVLAVLGPAGSAAAHASLVGTDPAPGAVLDTSPGTVTLTFDEPVRLAGPAATLVDAGGGAVASPVSGGGTQVLVDVPDDLADGSYLLSWRVVSADGHPIAGSLPFSVGEAGVSSVAPPPDPDPSAVRTVLGLAQGVGYAGLLLAGGLVFLAVLLLPRQSVADAVRRRVLRLAVGSAVLAGLAFLAVVPLTVAHQLGPEVTWSAAGRVWSVDLVGEPLLVAGDVVHLGGGAIWLGGLLGLVVAIRGLASRPELAAQTLARFSTWAGGAT